MTVEIYWENRQELNVAFMGSERECDRANRSSLWQVLGIYAVEGQLLEAAQSFYEGAKINCKSEQCLE